MVKRSRDGPVLWSRALPNYKQPFLAGPAFGTPRVDPVVKTGQTCPDNRNQTPLWRRRESNPPEAGYNRDCGGSGPILGWIAWQLSVSRAAFVSHSPPNVEDARDIKRPQTGAVPLLRALRPRQWVKNLLIFVPLVLAHRLGDTSAIIATVWAVLAFSACASCVYLLNDMLDLEADRAHPQKRFRPLAAGELPLSWARLLIPILITIACAISWVLLPPLFLAVLACYLVANVLYSTWLKRKPMIDVLVLANMYTLRLLAGGVATGTPVSEWLLAFSTFFFLSLAFTKRYSELIRLATEDQSKAKGRGYAVSDLSLIETMGPCSGYMSVLVLALYINSDAVKNLYLNSNLLWILCALLLYWISRLWFWAKRGELIEDPIVFATTDRTSLIVAAIGVATLAAAAWGG
jgi:4-hydroxybenzoate polyprenyltransferase